MDLSIYQIILGPVVSDKAYKLNQLQNKLVIRVHLSANKRLVAEALEKLFDVKVSAVHTVIRKGKTRRVRKKLVVGSTEKRAIVTLAEGYSLNLFEQAASEMPANNTAVTQENRGKAPAGA